MAGNEITEFCIYCTKIQYHSIKEMTVNKKLYHDKYFELVHYEYTKNHLTWKNEWTIQSWFEGYFIDFACFLLHLTQIPGLSAVAIRDKQKEKNIKTTLRYLSKRIPYLEDLGHQYYQYGDEDNDKRFEIIQVILEKYLFRTTFQMIMSQSNKLFECFRKFIIVF